MAKESRFRSSYNWLQYLSLWFWAESDTLASISRWYSPYIRSSCEYVVLAVRAVTRSIQQEQAEGQVLVSITGPRHHYKGKCTPGICKKTNQAVERVGNEHYPGHFFENLNTLPRIYTQRKILVWNGDPIDKLSNRHVVNLNPTDENHPSLMGLMEKTVRFISMFTSAPFRGRMSWSIQFLKDERKHSIERTESIVSPWMWQNSSYRTTCIVQCDVPLRNRSFHWMVSNYTSVHHMSVQTFWLS